MFLANLPCTSAFLESLKPSSTPRSPPGPQIGQHVESRAGPAADSLAPPASARTSPPGNLLEEDNDDTKDATTSVTQEQTLDPIQNLQNPLIPDLETLGHWHGHPDPGDATGLITHILGYCHCGGYHAI